MEALDLIVLGRRLAKLGERALRGGSVEPLGGGRALVLRDVFANPGSSVSAITRRTGLPQSYVSESIAWLSQEQILLTAPDPQDGRRTLASVSPAHTGRVAARASTLADGELVAELGEQRAAHVLALLQSLAELLAPERPGAIVESIGGGARAQSPGGSR